MQIGGKSRQSEPKQAKDCLTSSPTSWEQLSLPLFATASSAATSKKTTLKGKSPICDRSTQAQKLCETLEADLTSKGLRSLLDRLMRGDQLEIVVACRDRLARFGFELIEYLAERNGGKIVVLNSSEYCPESELVQDIIAIIHVFSCRLHGLRKYGSKIKKDQDLPQCTTEEKS